MNFSYQNLFIIAKFLVYFLSFIGFGYYVGQQYKKWKVFPEIIMTQSLIPNYEIPMPTVTVCSPLLTNSRDINLRNSVKNFKIKSFDIHDKCILPLIDACRLEYTESMIPQNLFNYVANATSIDILSECSSKTKDIFYRCFENQIRVDCGSLFNRILTSFGFCYSWNMLDLDEIIDTNITAEDFYSYKLNE